MSLQQLATGTGIGGEFVLGPQNPDTLVQPNGDVIAAMTLQVTESNFGVWFKFTVPLTVYNQQTLTGQTGASVTGTPSPTLINMIAARTIMIFALGSLAPVSDIWYLELVNTRTLFADYLIVTVSTPDLASSAEVQVAFDPAQQATAIAAIDAAYAQLQANLSIT